ncbi:MAG: hypothetical protein J6T96_05655, partial [Bacteroidales bacterium]|nr:hypothetical protein [Bacteroidales bacterium]
MTPQNTDIMLNDSSYVRLKGFASKQAVAEYLESTFLDNGELSEYYDLVSNTWDDSDLYQNFMNGDGEFEFSEQKYLSGAFPYELLFEGECDITMNGEGTLIFQANADLSTPQDLFAIYERDDITYTFYKPDNTVYATKSVTYGESPTDPSVGTGAPALPSDVTTRYALTSSNVDGNIVWTATEDSQAQSNYVESFYRVADLSQRWCEAGDSDETAVQLRNYTAGTSGQTTSFKMRLYTQIPLVYVVDGVIEGFAGSYNANNGVHPVRGDVLKNYSNYAISRMQRWTTRPLQAPQVYTDSTYAIRAMDGSICWFVDAACQQTRLTSITMHGTMEPMIVYAKLRNVYCLSFDGLSGGALTIANNVGTAPSYSYNGESLSLLAPQIISNSVYATTGTTISLSGLDFRKSTDTTFDVVSGWKYTSDDSAVSSTFSLTANTEVAPVTTTHDKPKLKIKLDFTHDFWDSDSDGIMHDDGKQVELDENNINSQLYVYSYYTDDGDDYVEITAKAATADNLTTNWVFDMSDIPLHVLGCDNEYILLECTNNSPSCLADNYTTTSPIIIYLVDIYKNGHLIFQDSSVWVGARIGFDEPNAIYERDDGKRLTTIYSSDINNINVVPNGYNTTPIEPMPARDVTYTFISYIT